MAYLAFRPSTSSEETAEPLADYGRALATRIEARAREVSDTTPEAMQVLGPLRNQLAQEVGTADSPASLLSTLARFVSTQAATAEGDVAFGWDEFGLLLDEERQRSEIFKQPEALRYLAALQEHLLTIDAVGKSNGLPDIVKTVHRELFEGDPERFDIPDTARAVAQCLITYEGSHRPHDVYHFVTPDYRQTSLWIQLKSGDNRDMNRVVEAVDEFLASRPPPFGLESAWFGLTYINVVWQEKMVAGMLLAVLGSFLVVLLMMVYLFRSGIWGVLSMIPLTVTISLIYGVIGLVGKDYDMPVAVLSSLTLGLAIDFAIHFLARARSLREQFGSWRVAHAYVFAEPARAILRNVIVIALGFLPLLAAPLNPYKTVGILLASILLVSGAGTLLILPALVRYLEPILFPRTPRARVTNGCVTWVVTGTAAFGLLGMNLRQFLGLEAGGLWGLAALVTVVVFIGCGRLVLGARMMSAHG